MQILYAIHVKLIIWYVLYANLIMGWMLTEYVLHVCSNNVIRVEEMLMLVLLVLIIMEKAVEYVSHAVTLIALTVQLIT